MELVAAAVAELVALVAAPAVGFGAVVGLVLEPIAVVWRDVVLGVAARVAPKSVQT